MSWEFGKVELDDRVRAKRHLVNDSRRAETSRGNATEITSTRASVKRDTKDISVSYTLADRELLHESELKRRSDLVAIL